MVETSSQKDSDDYINHPIESLETKGTTRDPITFPRFDYSDSELNDIF